jgi:hypothetical protein
MFISSFKKGSYLSLPGNFVLDLWDILFNLRLDHHQENEAAKKI